MRIIVHNINQQNIEYNNFACSTSSTNLNQFTSDKLMYNNNTFKIKLKFVCFYFCIESGLVMTIKKKINTVAN